MGELSRCLKNAIHTCTLTHTHTHMHTHMYTHTHAHTHTHTHTHTYVYTVCMHTHCVHCMNKNTHVYTHIFSVFKNAIHTHNIYNVRMHKHAHFLSSTSMATCVSWTSLQMLNVCALIKSNAHIHQHNKRVVDRAYTKDYALELIILF